jgi:D-alanyl-D-alanine carboxypeptidase (penicillin-binding protein 5/6)
MIRALAFLSVTWLFAPGHAVAQNGKPVALSAEAVLLLNDEGRILFAKNAEASHAPASLVKLMTLYLGYQDLAAGRVSLGDPVTISATAAQTPRYRMGLRAGEIVPFGRLLEGVAIASANDAASAVAEHLGGDEETFVARMNEEAKVLGLVSTRFANPHGLPDRDQSSTARDLATLTAALLESFPDVRALLGRKHFVYRGKVYSRRIPVFADSWGVRALKTGFTNEAGYNLAVAAWRGRERFLAILLGCQSRTLSFLDAQRLLQYGFSQSRVEPPAQNRRPPLRRSAT